MFLFLIFIICLVLSLIFTKLVINLAWRWQILDYPNSAVRKIHKKPTPLLGGLAIYLTYAFGSFFSIMWLGNFFDGAILPKYLFGILLGALIIVIGGFLDDKYNFKPKHQILFPILAALVVIICGLGIKYISNPFGQAWFLDSWRILLFNFFGWPYYLSVWVDLLTFTWLLGLMYSAKLLDCSDGLLSGVTVISAVVISVMSLRPDLNQPTLATLAVILAGSFAGFLIFNWHPAKIFLGESGSLLSGFLLGCLAILAGSKITTTLLVMGLLVIDMIWVIIQRIKAGQSPFLGDRRHLGHRLLALGWSQQKVAGFFYFISLAFGYSALVLPRPAKIFSLLFLILVVLIIEIWTQRQSDLLVQEKK
ncbi:MAG: MraY family glycosyltransferase [Candidatus Buchananbacteria bacterium]